MREYKFRAWDNYHQEMINWEQYKTELVSDDFINHGKGPLTIMQYTGIKDINGKEVYEGDVYSLRDGSRNYIVVWHDTSLIGNQIGTSSYAGLTYWQDGIEVLGNVFENPELAREGR